jgi:2-methylfumaryl-CoA hydratase
MPSTERCTSVDAMIRRQRYGRLLGDFEPGASFEHPWEVTVDDGMVALVAAAFLDATPLWASRAAARRAGLEGRPVSPLWLLNLGISFSVHDVSEQAIANLAYLDARFPEPCFSGDTLRARSTVLGVRPVTSGDKGVVHVVTELFTVPEPGDGLDAGTSRVVCRFERKALVRAGSTPAALGARADAPASIAPRGAEVRWPSALVTDRPLARCPGFGGYFEDFEPGMIFCHETGRTITESEHVLLTSLARNSHPLHVDEVYCQGSPPGAGKPGSAPGSFARTRVVFGGLVLAWVLALASRDTAGRALWEAGLDQGAHPRGVLAGDTLYAASKVLDVTPVSPHAGLVRMRVVGLRGTSAALWLEGGAERRRDDLFAPELGKEDGRVEQKVVEITRTLLVERRP